MTIINIPDETINIITRLKKHGYEAWVVGGCVRDSLLGITPSDWDMCTSAYPNDVIRIFNDCKTINTGLQHGTVTVVWDNMPIEVTTFRTEGSYSDGRHPDNVSFTSNLRDDLSRRDFTINAMAYCPEHGLADYWNGLDDLEHGIIRAVGNPSQRFTEDALRIMRCVRFAATFDFTIEPVTAAAAISCKNQLSNISPERINKEFSKTLIYIKPEFLYEFLPIFSQFIPELMTTIGFHQHNPYHTKDVFWHTMDVLNYVRPYLPLKLAALLHDIGKPDSFLLDADGIGHFRGHNRVSYDMTLNILKRLKYDNHTIDLVSWLVKYHDYYWGPSVASMKKFLSKCGTENMSLLLELKLADQKAHVDKGDTLNKIMKAFELLEQIVESKDAICINDLAINGNDLIELGVIPGPAIGRILDEILTIVHQNPKLNNPIELTKAAMKLIEDEGIVLKK